MVDDSNLEPTLLVCLTEASANLEAEDLGRVSRNIDQFVVAITRHMGTQISAQRAFEFADIALLDIRRQLGDPAGVYDIALSFALRSETIADCAYVPLDDRLRRDSTGDVEPTRAAMLDVIAGSCMPKDRMQALTDQINALNDSAAARTPGTEVEFAALSRQFSGTLGVYQSMSYLSAAQVSSLSGLVFFGAPAAAATCWIPLTWKAQIVIAIGVLVIGGIYLIYESVKAGMVQRGLRDFIEDCSKTTQQVKDEVDDKIQDFDADDKADLKKILKARRKALNKRPDLSNREKARIRTKYNAALGRL